MPPLLRAMRPQEWVKNTLVFAGLLFSGKVDEGAAVADATLAFVAFCAISSAGYLFNDLRDAEHDRRHPDKRHRPIASGALAPATATTAALALAALAIALPLATVDAEVAGLVALYGAITAAYSLFLKRLVIIDVMTIASLFLLRVVAGAVAVEAQASEFLLVCTAMLALFLGFTKRRQEALIEQEAPDAAGASATRPVLEHYSIPFLDQMVAMVTAAAIISYVIYAVNSPLVGSRMLATAPSVLYGVFRYLYLIYDRRDTRSTAAILVEDPGMVFAGHRAALASWMRLIAALALSKGPAHVVDGACAVLWIPPGGRIIDGPEEAARAEAVLERELGPRGSEVWGAFVEIGRRRPPEPPAAAHLLHIATRPERRGEGLGAIASSPGLAECDRRGWPAFLNSTTPRNHPFYERFGFTALESVDPGAGAPTIHPMWREPR